jgi:hypothetical protein
VNFQNEVGSMHSVIYCDEHDLSKKKVHNLCAISGSPGGEVSLLVCISFALLFIHLHQSALQVFCQLHKQAETKTHALLRKANRLDTVLKSKVEVTPAIAPPLTGGPQCHKCSTAFSPAFHKINVPSSTSTRKDTWLCHRCHHNSIQTNGIDSKGSSVNTP